MRFHDCPFAKQLHELLLELALGERLERSHEELGQLLENLSWLASVEDCDAGTTRWRTLHDHGAAQAQAILEYWMGEPV